jgi:hypothetical protein
MHIRDVFLSAKRKGLHIKDVQVLAKRLHILCTSKMCSPSGNTSYAYVRNFQFKDMGVQVQGLHIKNVFPERAAHLRCVPFREAEGAAHQRCASASEAVARSFQGTHL